jgi:exonuclease III
MCNTLKIVTWNANGLLKHIPELQPFFEIEKIDISLVSETHLTEKSHINIPNFACYHTPHPVHRARGGASVLVKKSIPHFEHCKLKSQIMQVTAISSQAKNKELNVAAIYCPPRCSRSKEDYCNLFQTLGNNFIIGGDYNAKHTYWGSRLTNSKGRELYQAGLNKRCEFLSSGSPTYWPTDPMKVPDLIDCFVINGISINHLHVENSEDLLSDHTPVILSLSESVMQKESPPMLTNKKTNWNIFREKLDFFY